MLPYEIHHAKVLYDYRIQPRLIIWQKIFIKRSVDFPVFEQCIYSKKYFPVVDMPKINCRKHLVPVKILRIGSCTKH